MEPGCKIKGKNLGEWPPEGMPVVKDNVTARVGQEALGVVIEESVAPSSEKRAAARPADVYSVQMPGDVQGKRSTGGGGALRGEEIEFAEVAPD